MILRKVEANIDSLGLSIGDVVTITLLNVIGKPVSFIEDGKLISCNKQITIDNKILSLELWENDNSNSTTYYQLTVNDINYNFTVPKGTGTHDLMSLFQTICTDEVYYIFNGQISFETQFIEKIKKYFDGEEPYFTKNQKEVFEQFIYFADNVYGTDRTIDKIEMLNIYLGSL